MPHERSNRAEAEVKGQAQAWGTEEDTSLGLCSDSGVSRVVGVNLCLCPQVSAGHTEDRQHPWLRKSLPFCLLSHDRHAHLALLLKNGSYHFEKKTLNKSSLCIYNEDHKYVYFFSLLQNTVPVKSQNLHNVPILFFLLFHRSRKKSLITFGNMNVFP